LPIQAEFSPDKPPTLTGLNPWTGLTQLKTLDQGSKGQAYELPRLNLLNVGVAPEAECFTSESKALRTLYSRRDWNRSQPQLVPIQMLGVKSPLFILKL